MVEGNPSYFDPNQFYMTTKFSQQNNIFTIHDSRSFNIHDELPPDVYVLKFNPMEGFFLEVTEKFDLPQKLYGNVHREADRVLRTYHNRSTSTGILLAGERGSGKTMLAKKISIDAMAQGIPTILINSPLTGPDFNTFIQAITQDCVILLDEFEKVYDDEAQTAILTLLDGTVMTKKLFIFTSNDKWKISAYMRNRPGRIFYFKEYEGIEAQFIEEYCQDNLKPELQKYISTIVQYAQMFFAFNFDMLKAIVEEMNRYDETPQEAMQMLNAKPAYGEGRENYEAKFFFNGLEIGTNIISGNPLLQSGIPLQLWVNTDKKFSQVILDDEQASKAGLEEELITITNRDISLVEKTGKIHFKHSQYPAFTVIVDKVKEPKTNVFDHISAGAL